MVGIKIDLLRYDGLFREQALPAQRLTIAVNRLGYNEPARTLDALHRAIDKSGDERVRKKIKIDWIMDGCPCPWSDWRYFRRHLKLYQWFVSDHGGVKYRAG